MSDDLLDFPTAWAIQREVGEQLNHKRYCSFIAGWSAISGPGLLCDCGAIVRERKRLRAVSGDQEGTSG